MSSLKVRRVMDLESQVWQGSMRWGPEIDTGSGASFDGKLMKAAERVAGTTWLTSGKLMNLRQGSDSASSLPDTDGPLTAYEGLNIERSLRALPEKLSLHACVSPSEAPAQAIADKFSGDVLLMQFTTATVDLAIMKAPLETRRQEYHLQTFKASLAHTRLSALLQ